MMPWKLGELVQGREAYGEALLTLGRERNDIVVLDSDLQRSNQTYAFGQENPDRFFDMGISEADMISTAAGISAMGFYVFATSFAMFLPGRCYDQIRLQIAYAKSNVKLAGVSAGLTQGPDGASHQSFDDIALMRQLPGMIVIVPADANEAYQAVLKAAEVEGPVYLRFGRYPTPVILDENYDFKIGESKVLRDGVDLVFFTTGIMVAKALKVAENLAEEGIDASVINVATIKPIDKTAILDYSQGKKLVFSLEEHSIIGGLGSAIAEILAETHSTSPLVRIGMDDQFGQSGVADELLEHYGLSVNSISRSVLKHYQNLEKY